MAIQIPFSLRFPFPLLLSPLLFLTISLCLSLSLFVPHPISSQSTFPLVPLVVPLLPTTDGGHYTATFQIGTPLQSISLVVDTGTSDLIFFQSPLCVKCFSSSSSSSYNDNVILNVNPEIVRETQAFAFEYSDDGESIVDIFPYVFEDNIYINTTIPFTSTSTLLGNSDSAITQPIPNSLLSTTLNIYGVSNYLSIYDIYDVGGIWGINYAVNSITVRQASIAGFPLPNGNYPPSTIFFSPYTQGLYDTTFFALDFSGGEMHIGGVAEVYKNSNSLIPSAVSYSSAAGGFYFSMLTMSFSDGKIEFLHPYLTNGAGGYLSVLVDTGSQGLTLPAEIFDAIVSWMPMYCDSPAGASSGTMTTCFVDPIIANSLPTVEFTIENPNSPNNPSGQVTTFYFAMSDLVLPNQFDQNGLHRMAITRSFSFSDTNIPLFSIGTRVLKSFYVAIDMNIHTVYFAQSIHSQHVSVVPNLSSPSLSPTVTFAKSSQNLLPPVICSGQQQHLTGSNVCLDPPCGDYYLMTFNSNTNKCVLSPSFHILVSIFIAVFIVVEIGFQEGTTWIAKKIIRGEVGERANRPQRR